MTFRVIVLPKARSDIDRNADFPESNALSAENNDFPYEIRDKLVGLGSRPSDVESPPSA